MKKIVVAIVAVCLIISVSALTQNESDKTVYITFDDGPTHNLPLILDTLKKYNAKATFFLLKDRIVQYPDLVKRIASEGHSIGLHGASHDVNVIYSTPSSPLEEMNETNDCLYNICGFRSRLVRTPYGSYPYMSFEQYQILSSANYKIWDWSVDPRDSVGTPELSDMLKKIEADLKGNTTPIVLLHDRKSTAKKLDNILTYFSSRGYKFASLDETMEPVNFTELYGSAKSKA